MYKFLELFSFVEYEIGNKWGATKGGLKSESAG